MKNDLIVKKGGKCIGSSYGVKCTLSANHFVHTGTGKIYICKGCKDYYKKLWNGNFRLTTYDEIVKWCKKGGMKK